MSENTKIIGVIGGSWCSDEIYEIARQVGCEIAQRGAALICGGLSGVMEAACRGARSAGGLTIGVLPGKSKTDANPFVDLSIATGLGDARNVIIALTADALIAIDGSYGTLSEISFGLKHGKPVIGLHVDFEVEGLRRAETIEQAIELAFS